MARMPDFLSQTPTARSTPPFEAGDVLSLLLDGMRLNNAVFGCSRMGAPWGIEVGRSATTPFHAVLEGECWLTVEGNSPFRLEAGDVVLLPGGHRHRLSDHPETAALPIEQVLGGSRCPSGGVLHGGDGATALLACGAFQFIADPRRHPLLSSLPPMLHVPAKDRPGQPWLEVTMKFIECELSSQRTGAHAVVKRLADVLFVQVLRHHVAHLPPESRGVLRGLSDARIGATLRRIHEETAAPWTVTSLAAECAMSRSAFAERFVALVSESPMAYLTRWRLYQAATLLRSTEDSVAEIASRVGYGSDAALSKSFHRYWGVTPGQWRRSARQELTA